MRPEADREIGQAEMPFAFQKLLARAIVIQEPSGARMWPPRSTPPPLPRLGMVARLLQTVRMIAVSRFVKVGVVAGTTIIGLLIAYLPLIAFYQTQLVQDEDRINRAWTLILSAKTGEGGNVGLVNALEALRKRKIDLGVVALPGAYLASIQLPEAELGGARFPRARLDRADLRQADLNHSDLSGAKINFANLEGARLEGADLHQASLRGAKLKGANLKGAKLAEADLSGADLSNADLRGADLTDALLFRANLHGPSTRLDLADLNRADLSVADMREAHLDGARLTHTVLHGADLAMASFHGAIFQQTDLRRANLAGVNLRRELAATDERPGFSTQAILDGACVDMNTQLPPNAPTVDGNGDWCGPPRVPANLFAQNTISAMLEVIPQWRSATAARTIYYLLPERIDEFQTESQKMIEVVFSKMGYGVISVDAEENPALQVAQFEEAAKKKPEAIILNAVDIANMEPIISKHPEIMTLVYDRAVREIDVPFSVTANGYQTGKIAAVKSLDLLQQRHQEQRGRILEIVGDPADSHSTDFQKGFESVIEGMPQILLK